MLLLRWILLPISLIYAVISWLRNRLYDFNLLKSHSFPLPIIVVGNLAVGGTGKSPMTEYILRIIGSRLNVAVLSRGYGRKTRGFRSVETNSLAADVGDEPLQIKKKFPANTVVVSEDRCFAIEKIMDKHDAILLDDAYQHRRLKPSFSILLFDFASLQKPIISLPTGNFRDSLQESRRANIIVVTKSPTEIDSQARFKIMSRLAAYSKAPVFFSSISYANVVDANENKISEIDLSKMSVLLLTGIANPIPLQEYVKERVSTMQCISYADHHAFTAKDIAHIKASYEGIKSSHKIILTTEKDFQRLSKDFYTNYPVFYLPITQKIKFNQQQQFESLIENAFTAKESVN